MPMEVARKEEEDDDEELTLLTGELTDSSSGGEPCQPLSMGPGLAGVIKHYNKEEMPTICMEEARRRAKWLPS